MANTRITAAVLTLNEELNIEFCLRSVSTWCDEIIVVDMLSDDGTREIARLYTDLVLDHPRIVDFGLARQLGVDRSTSDWILSIDADEVVTPELAKWVRKFIEFGSALRRGVDPAGERVSWPPAAQHAMVAGQAAPVSEGRGHRDQRSSPRARADTGVTHLQAAQAPGTFAVALHATQP